MFIYKNKSLFRTAEFLPGLLLIWAAPFVASADLSGLPVHGFADINWGFATLGQPVRELSRGFSIGNFDLYLTPQFTDRVRALIELNFETGLDEKGIGTDLERLQIGYTVSDDLTIWSGRFHTPYGYWNNAYHHGAQIQTTIYKPRFLDWEDRAGFLPSHSIGLWASGRIRGEDSKITYDLFVSNGSRITDGFLDTNIVNDDNTSIAIGANLAYFFGGALKGLRLGLHGLSEEVDSYDTANANIAQARLNFVGGYAVYEENNIEFNTEYYRFLNSDLSAPGRALLNSTAAFVQLGYAIMPDLIPNARIEYTSIDQTDGYFNTQKNGFSYTRAALGIKYNVNSKSVLKLEANQTVIRDTTAFVSSGSFNELRTQYAISF